MLALTLFLAAPAAYAAPSVELVGLDHKTITVGIAELEQLQPADITVPDPHTKTPTRYRGVPLSRVLGLAGISFEGPLRGPHLVAKLEIDAADGYRVAFSLPELDPLTGSTEVFLVFAADGESLDPEIGPFRLAVPTDKRGARWVRQVTRIVLIP
jgi:DMSO/TMAO reductase YedYZ molybdopterin-dependent catalytic subunit